MAPTQNHQMFHNRQISNKSMLILMAVPTLLLIFGQYVNDLTRLQQCQQLAPSNIGYLRKQQSLNWMSIPLQNQVSFFKLSLASLFYLDTVNYRLMVAICMQQDQIQSVNPHKFLSIPSSSSGIFKDMRFLLTLSVMVFPSPILSIQAIRITLLLTQLLESISCQNSTHLQSRSSSWLSLGIQSEQPINQMWQVMKTFLPLFFIQQKFSGSLPTYEHSFSTSSPISSISYLLQAIKSSSPLSACPPGNTTFTELIILYMHFCLFSSLLFAQTAILLFKVRYCFE